MRVPNWSVPLAGGLVAAVAVTCFVQALRLDTQARQVVPPASSRVNSVSTQASVDMPHAVATRGQTTTGPSSRHDLQVAPPTRVEVPAVSMSAVVVPIGLAPDGSMAVPPSTVAGWYRLGPTPGAVGPAVLVGHVDSRAGPAVFYRLTAVRVGDILVVVHADMTRTRFSVSAVTVVRKSRFPTADVFAPTDKAALRVITCTGEFDAARGSYLDSLIVWATAEP